MRGEFERAALDFRVTFRPDGRVAALFVTPGAPATPPDYSAPAGAPYRAEEVTVRTPSGVALAGTLTLPAGAAGRVPAVLLLTGSGPQDRDESVLALPGWRPFRQVADTLGRRGIAVLRLDDRGVGGSGGSAAATTLAESAEDARAALAFLRARPEVDPARVGIVGHSEGGYVASMAAVDDRGAARARSWSRRRRAAGARWWMYQNRLAIEAVSTLAPHVDSLLVLAAAQRDSLAASSRWFGSLMAHDPLPIARRLRLPCWCSRAGPTARSPPPRRPRWRRHAPPATATWSCASSRPQPPPGPRPGRGRARYAALPGKQVAPEVLGALADWLAAKLR